MYTNSLHEVRKCIAILFLIVLLAMVTRILKNFALQYTPDMTRIFARHPFDITPYGYVSTIDDKNGV